MMPCYGRNTVDTVIAIFDEQIGTDLPSGKLPTLIVHPGEFWVLQEVGVKADPLDIYPDEGYPL